MEISQKHASNKIRFVFHDDRVDQAWQDSSTSRSFSVPYTEISRERQTLTERHVWFRNAGLIWMLIGSVWVIASWLQHQFGPGWFWLLLGVLCYATYRLRVTRFVILPSDKGNLLVIDDEDGKRIVNEIETRRAKQFREEYDFFPQNDTPEQLRKRFNWLHREGALSDEELKQRMEKVDALAQPAQLEQVEPAVPGERLLH